MPAEKPSFLNLAKARATKPCEQTRPTANPMILESCPWSIRSPMRFDHLGDKIERNGSDRCASFSVKEHKPQLA